MLRCSGSHLRSVGDRSVVGNCRPVSLTSVVCKQMEHFIAVCLRRVWEISKWVYEGRNGFRPGHCYKSEGVTVCQDMADSLDQVVRTDAIKIDFSKVFDFFTHDRLLSKIATTGVLLRALVWLTLRLPN
jgi:hypothetical protein